MLHPKTDGNVNASVEVHHLLLENYPSNGKKNVCIPSSFLVTNVCNQGKTLCSLCITVIMQNVLKIAVYFPVAKIYKINLYGGFFFSPMCKHGSLRG